MLLLVPNLLQAHEDGLGKHIVEALRIENLPPPKIDGRLDDTAWQNATFVSKFIQLTPNRGQPATDDTAFAIAYDHNHIYVGFRCFDAAPEKIINRITRRGNVYESDVISFFVDPHHDHRTGYKFATTPGGVQSDAYRLMIRGRIPAGKESGGLRRSGMNWAGPQSLKSRLQISGLQPKADRCGDSTLSA